MRGSVIVLIILMLNIVSNAQDWIEKDGIEYNCAVVLSILGDYGDESLTRQSGLQGSVEDYFEGEFPTCSHPIAELATAVPESIESEDEDHLDDTPAQDAGDGCYPYDDAIVTRHTTIKASYGFTKATVGQAKVGNTFEVTGSKRYGAKCWVTTNVGWLFGNYVNASSQCHSIRPARLLDRYDHRHSGNARHLLSLRRRYRDQGHDAQTITQRGKST